MPGEFGQISSYVAAMKIVTPNGDLVVDRESDPELLQAARSSYGLFGIVVEVTLRVKPLQQLSPSSTARSARAVRRPAPGADRHRRLADVLHLPVPRPGQRRVPPVRRPGRRPGRAAEPDDLEAAQLHVAHGGARRRAVRRSCIPWRPGRYQLLNWFDTSLHVAVDRLLRSPVTLPPDQMIRYPEKAGWTGFTSSIWAFPEPVFGRALTDYCDFVQRYDSSASGGRTCSRSATASSRTSRRCSATRTTGRRSRSTRSPRSKGWIEFLDAFNVFCTSAAASPLLNQTRGVTREMASRAFGERLGALEDRHAASTRATGC